MRYAPPRWMLLAKTLELREVWRLGFSHFESWRSRWLFDVLARWPKFYRLKSLKADYYLRGNRINSRIWWFYIHSDLHSWYAAAWRVYIYVLKCRMKKYLLELTIWRGFGGLVISMLASGTRVRGFEPVGFFGCPNNLQHAFLQRGSERICPMSQLCGM